MAEYKDSEEIKRQLRIWVQECEDWLEYKEANCFRDCIDLIDQIPAADVVEVVRCKDCKHFAPRADKKYGICFAIEDTFPVSVPANHWCSFGERWTRRNNHEV